MVARCWSIRRRTAPTGSWPPSATPPATLSAWCSSSPADRGLTSDGEQNARMGYVAMAARDALQFCADRALQTLQLPVLGLRVADGEGDEPGPAATGTANRTLIVRSFHARYFPTRSRCPVKG